MAQGPARAYVISMNQSLPISAARAEHGAPRYGQQRRQGRLFAAVAAAILLLIPTVSHAEPDDARDIVNAFHETLLTAMKKADELGLRGRYDLLAPAVDKAYHLDLTARQSAGRRAWKDASPDEREAYLDAFRRWTVGTYAEQFDGWSGQEFQDHGEKPGPQSGTVLVETEMTGEEPVTFTYLMVKSDGRWGVYDVLVRRGTTSISQLAKHISEFKSIVRKGLPALTATLTGRIEAQRGK
jgi:phospholipid transport system substrate-binding protein